MKIKLALDWTPNTNHIGFFIAKELGYFNKFDLNVNIIDPRDDNYALTPAKKVELGKALYKILNKGVVQEESFPPEWQKALDLYLKQGHQIDPETVVLKPWQMELMKHIDNPSDRKILWVQGEKCGEGKTWFQKYVQSLLGRKRVVAGGINIHSNSAVFCLHNLNILFF